MRSLFIILMFISIQVNAADCYETSILSPSPFLGNDGEIVKLADGTFWEVKYEYNYMYQYYPSAIICPKSQRLIVDGKSLNVTPIQ